MELFSASYSAPALPLGGFVAGDDPIQVRNIDGLGPVGADIVSTPFATGRGEQYQGSSSGKRNIVMTLGLNPNWVDQTMASLRQLLYRYLLPEQWTKLRFYSDHLPTVDIEGYVETFEPNIFSEDPERQISVICPKPDFVDIDPIIVTGVVDDGSTEHLINYDGNLETGFEFRVDRTIANAAYTGPLTVTVTNPGELPQIIEMNPVTIDTSKYLKLVTKAQFKRIQSVAIVDGAATNLLQKMTAGSVWPVLKPGENLLQVDANENDQAWTIAYFNRFAGL
jgi:hypothetical protein